MSPTTSWPHVEPAGLVVPMPTGLAADDIRDRVEFRQPALDQKGPLPGSVHAEPIVRTSPLIEAAHDDKLAIPEAPHVLPAADADVMFETVRRDVPRFGSK